MAATSSIEIGGIHFVLTSRDITLSQDIPALYRPFYGREYSTDTNVFNINVTKDVLNIPQTDNITKIFDSGLSWSMFKDEEHYYISLDPSAICSTMGCHALIDRGITEATLYSSDIGRQEGDGKADVRNPFSYPLDQILQMYVLAGRKGAVIHAAGMSVNGRGFIFPGKSGAGKSTLSRLFLGRDTVEMLSDDRMIVRKTGSGFHAFGTPWAGDAGIAENKNAPLAGIFFIHHGNENMIKEIGQGRAMERLMPVTSIPWYDEAVMSDILSFCEELVSHVPAYELHFKPDKGVAEFLEKFVSAQAR